MLWDFVVYVWRVLHSIFSIVTRLWTGGSGSSIPSMDRRFFLSLKCSDPTLGPTQPLPEWILGFLPGVKMTRVWSWPLRLWTSGAVPLLPYMPSWCGQRQLHVLEIIGTYCLLQVDMIQGVPGGMCILRESVPYVKLYRYNPKHLYPKLNGYGDHGQRKVWTSCISAYCTSTAVAQ